jgi:hypothetical protein
MLAAIAATAFVSCLLVWSSFLHPSVPAPPVLVPGTVPVGRLGQRLGTYVTIAGYRSTYPIKTNHGTMEVDTVDGQELARPIAIEISNVELPADTRCVIKGYETAHLVGAPPAFEQAAKEAGKPFRPPQSVWQINCYFVALAVVSPNDLKISKETP